MRVILGSCITSGGVPGLIETGIQEPYGKLPHEVLCEEMQTPPI